MTQTREIAERYRLKKILKSSRTGSVLQAVDLTSGEPVAVKLMTPGLPPGAELDRAFARFLALAEGLAGLSHPALPSVRDFGLSPDGGAFLVTELLAGRGFETVTGVAPRRLLALVAEVVDCLRLLSAQGLSHGNLSPDNLFVPEEGGVKVLGLGTAILRGPLQPSAPNLRFRAPEEAEAERRMEAEGSAPPPEGEGWRSDLWSLAQIACSKLDVNITFPDSPEPRVTIPMGLGFLLADAEALRLLLDGGLRRRAGDRPSLSRAASALRQAIGAAEPIPAAAAAGARPGSVEKTRPGVIEETRPAFAPAPAGTPATAAGTPAAAAPGKAAASSAAASSAAASPAVSLPAPPPASLAAFEPDLLDEPAPSLPDIDDMLVEEAAAAPALAASAAPATPAAPAARLLSPRASPAARPAGQGAAGAPPATGAAPPPATTGWRGRLRSLGPLPIAGAAAALLLVAAGGLWLAGRGAPPPAGPAAPAQPAPPPLDPPFVRLATARDALAAGDDHRALAVLQTLTPADQSTLPPEGCELLRCLEETLAATAPERLARDLASGFETGSLALLRQAVATAADSPEALAEPSPETLERLEKARQAVALAGQAEAAGARGDVVAALSSFGAVALLVPDLRDEGGARERAAKAIEDQADALIREARYAEALTRLEPLTRTWPDRPGLAEREKTYRAQEKAESEIEKLLAAASIAERRKKPDEVLPEMRRTEPTPHLTAQYREVQGRLEALLARLDGKPPQVELREGFGLSFDRGMVASLSVRVRDDYKVAGVKIYARPSGGRMRDVSYERKGFTYTVDFPPSFHGNGDVDFYVVATDVSGHQGTLGSRDQPLQIKRKRGFREEG